MWTDAGGMVVVRTYTADGTCTTRTRDRGGLPRLVEVAHRVRSDWERLELEDGRVIQRIDLGHTRRVLGARGRARRRRTARAALHAAD